MINVILIYSICLYEDFDLWRYNGIEILLQFFFFFLSPEWLFKYYILNIKYLRLQQSFVFNLPTKNS